MEMIKVVYSVVIMANVRAVLSVVLTAVELDQRRAVLRVSSLAEKTVVMMDK
jgi:hypothetical protein